MDSNTYRKLSLYFPHDIINIIDEYVKVKFMEIKNPREVDKEYHCHRIVFDMWYYNKINCRLDIEISEIDSYIKYHKKWKNVLSFNTSYRIQYNTTRKQLTHYEHDKIIDSILTTEEHKNVIEEFNKLFNYIEKYQKNIVK